MNIRVPYAKIKQAVIDTGMTYAQIKARDWQFSLPDILTPEEIIKVKRLQNLVLRWLKQDFRERQYAGTLKTNLFSKFEIMASYLQLQGLSDKSGEEKLDRAYREWKEARNG
jgi:hypothetical protein